MKKKIKILKNKELMVFYKKIIETPLVLRIEEFIKISGIIITLAIAGLIFLNKNTNAVKGILCVIIVAVVLIVFAVFVIIFLKRKATFTYVDLMTAILEYKQEFEDKKSKRKTIDLISLENRILKRTNYIESMEKDLDDLNKKEEYEKNLTEDEKHRQIILEDDIIIETRRLIKDETDIDLYKKIILLQDKEDSLYESRMKSVEKFAKEKFGFFEPELILEL